MFEAALCNRTGRGREDAHFMPAGVSRPLPALMLVMLSFSASLLAKRLSGAGVKICTINSPVKKEIQTV